MKKEVINLALYKVVILEIKDSDKKYVGWLVRGHYNPKRYEILPIDFNNDNVLCFPASLVKSITYVSNGVVLR